MSSLWAQPARRLWDEPGYHQMDICRQTSVVNHMHEYKCITGNVKNTLTPRQYERSFPFIILSFKTIAAGGHYISFPKTSQVRLFPNLVKLESPDGCIKHWYIFYNYLWIAGIITFPIDTNHMRGTVHATSMVDTICKLIWFRIPTAYPSTIMQLMAQKILTMNPTIWRLEGPTSSVAANETYIYIVASI